MIRRATYKDVDSINEIGKQLHDNFAYLFKMENVVNTSYSRVYLYEENNKVLGFIHVDSHFEIMDLINIVVLKEYQNKGIGSIVADELSKIAYEELGINDIIYTSKMENIQSQRSLEKIGATFINAHDGYHYYTVNLKEKYETKGR